MITSLARTAAACFLPSVLVLLPMGGKTAETFRVIHLQILQPNGAPAADRDVELRGFDRRAMGPIPFLYDVHNAGTHSEDQRKARLQGWLFTTDSHGDITARIGDFAGWKDDRQRPGWGTYIFVVPPGPHDAGAASQMFWICDSSDAGDPRWDGSEWGQPIPLPPGGLHLTMALQNGYTLYGQLLDDHDHRTPVPNISVATWNDLHVDTHTGYGGQIFSHGAVSDANGEFKLEHLYHTPLYLRIGAVWMTTNQGGKWVTQDEDVLTPPDADKVRMTIGVMAHPDFHYTGIVRDAAGKPVANAQVTIGISSEPSATTYGDTHHFEKTTTDTNGHYDLAASSPWATFIDAEDGIRGRAGPGGRTSVRPFLRAVTT